MIKGNALQPENMLRLHNAQSQLKQLKLAKLKARQFKHPESEVWDFYGFEQHLESELEEFKDGWANQDPENMIEELADMANIIDMLATLIIEEDKSLFQIYPTKKKKHNDADQEA